MAHSHTSPVDGSSWGLFPVTEQADYTGLYAPFSSTPSVKEEPMTSSEPFYDLYSSHDSDSSFLTTPTGGASLRRVRSATAILPTITPGSAIYPYQEPSSPASPLSETIQTPRDGQTMSGGSWFAAAQDSFLNNPPSSSALQGRSASALGPPSTFNQTSPTTVHMEAPPRQRRRHPSAQPSLPSQATPATGGNFAAGDMPMSLSPPKHYGFAGSAPMAHQPSVEEVNQFFSDMSEILGPDAMAAISPPAGGAPVEHTSPYGAPQPIPPRPRTPPQTYNISGVLLDAEDYARYTSSPSTSFQYPQSAPAHQTSFNAYDIRTPSRGAPRPPRASPPPHPGYRQSLPNNNSPFAFNPDYSSGSSQPTVQYQSYEQYRPRSAPASPDLGGGAFAPFGGAPTIAHHPHHPNHPISAPLARRRGSSMDAIPRTFPNMIPAGQPFGHHQPAYQQQQQQQRPPHPRHQLHQPYAPPPSSHHPGFAPPQSRSNHPHANYNNSAPPPRTDSRGMYHIPPPSSTPPPRRMSIAPSPTTPNGRRASVAPSSPTKRKGKNDGGIAFINYSAKDSRKLLSGVAPSGSSKRKREEEAAEEEHENGGKRKSL